MKDLGRFRGWAPPKRDPGARPEPRTGVKQSGSGRRYPVLGPPTPGTSVAGARNSSPCGDSKKNT